MSHQTGIVADETLLDFLSKARDEHHHRLIKISISSLPSLVLSKSFDKKGSWKDDWNSYIPTVLHENEPCYLFISLDDDSSTNPKWIFISWSPEHCSVRQKMLYASTKATLKKEFGGGYIRDELYGNHISDVSLAAYERHLVSKSSPAYSPEELEREEEHKSRQNDVSVNSKQAIVSGLSFPCNSEILSAFSEYKNNSINYLQLRIDTEEEIIALVSKAKLSNLELSKAILTCSPRYHCFAFHHTHKGGDSLTSNFFIYTMPENNVSIKERMLYSTCQNSLVQEIESQGILIAKKIQIDSADEVSEDLLLEELYPKKNETQPKFARPPPPHRNNRRTSSKS